MRLDVCLVILAGLVLQAQAQGQGSGKAKHTPIPQAGAVSAATLRNFILPDPLKGENGLPPSPAAPVLYGAIHLGLDTDGDAIQAVDESDIRYFDGHYYLYGTSFTCGSFNYAPGVTTGPLIPTKPESMYRYCGLTIYTSDDLMNWTLVGTHFPREADTGTLYYVKKPRVVYSPRTGLYNLWFINGQDALTTSTEIGEYEIIQSSTPVGPWGPVKRPSVAQGVLGPVDYSINTGPDGASYLITSHAGINIFKLNEEKTGTVDVTPVEVADLSGGIGLSYHKDWWYITGSNRCGNCLAAPFYYIRARDPHGPWTNPDNGSAAAPLHPTLLSKDSGTAQMHGSVMLPDGHGGSEVLIPGTHYRSSPTGAPGPAPAQPGDNNLALSGLYLTPLSFDAEGHALPLVIKPIESFPLAHPVRAKVPAAYQAALAVTHSRSVSQSWVVQRGHAVCTILLPIFQRTVDASAKRAPDSPIQEPQVNALLLASLQLPTGQVYEWRIEPRSVRWGPERFPLILPKPFSGTGRMTLTLKTEATNGGYGIVVGAKGGRLSAGVYTVLADDGKTEVPDAEMLLETMATRPAAPRMTLLPVSVRVVAGQAAGFVVQAKGLGLGYQWYRNGEIVLGPDGLNESDSATLRLSKVTAAQAGVYTVTIFSPVGSVTSVPVTLTVVP